MALLDSTVVRFGVYSGRAVAALIFAATAFALLATAITQDPLVFVSAGYLTILSVIVLVGGGSASLLIDRTVGW